MLVYGLHDLTGKVRLLLEFICDRALQKTSLVLLYMSTIVEVSLKAAKVVLSSLFSSGR